MSNYNTELQSNNTDLQAILDMINELPEANNGVELPTLTNEGTASDLLSGKELIDQDGNIVTGTIATKTSSDLTASGATVTVPSGYYASQTTKSVSTATQATPSISVNSSGLITASATQSAGYVSSGTKSATKQLTTQAAKTITPSTSSQTAVASGVYTTGVVTIGAIPNEYITTTDATASTEEIFEGETAYVNGQKITGTFPSSEIDTQADLISQIATALEGKASGGGSSSGGDIATCTVTFTGTAALSPSAPIVTGLQYICYTNNGIESYSEFPQSSSFSKNNIACGSFMCLTLHGCSGIRTYGCEKLNGSTNEQAYIHITASNGETATITAE